jgi:hypothetical protein
VGEINTSPHFVVLSSSRDFSDYDVF